MELKQNVILQNLLESLSNTMLGSGYLIKLVQWSFKLIREGNNIVVYDRWLNNRHD